MSGDWFAWFVAGMWVSIGIRDLGEYMRRRRNESKPRAAVSARITSPCASLRHVLSRRTGSGQTKNAQTLSKGASVTEAEQTIQRALHELRLQKGNGAWCMNRIEAILEEGLKGATS